MKGHAILVGVSEVNSNHYNSDKKFNEVRENVLQLKSVLNDCEGFDVKDEDIFVGNQATLLDLNLRLEYYSELSKKEEGFLVLYFGGHGFKNDREDNNQVTFYCLYDQMLAQQEIHHKLMEFTDRFNILWVVDTCYALGMSPIKKELRVLPPLVEEFGSNKSFCSLKNFYESKMGLRMASKLSASVFFLAAIGKIDNARERGLRGMSYFTQKMIDLANEWPKQEDGTNYFDFFEVLHDQMNPDYKPAVPREFGARTDFFKKTIAFKTITK